MVSFPRMTKAASLWMYTMTSASRSTILESPKRSLLGTLTQAYGLITINFNLMNKNDGFFVFAELILEKNTFGVFPSYKILSFLPTFDGNPD